MNNVELAMFSRKYRSVLDLVGKKARLDSQDLARRVYEPFFEGSFKGKSRKPVSVRVPLAFESHFYIGLIRKDKLRFISCLMCIIGHGSCCYDGSSN